VLAQLIPLQGGEPITIDKDVTVVGRLADHCDVILERKSVSKLHCVIVKTDGLLFVRDLSSTNGTKVNGQRITRGALLPGDQLSFAGEKFRVHMGPSPLNGSGSPAVSPGNRTEMFDSPSPFPEIDEEGESPLEGHEEFHLDDDDDEPEAPEDDLVE
jgi:pSer/pThr/pTyr-binding forkhead associated (FHA) protein